MISVLLDPFYRSLFIHVAPIRFPNVSSSMIQKLQTLQNSAICVATGSVKMTSIDNLPEETKVLHVHDHLSLLCPQYFTRTLQSINSSQNVVTSFSFQVSEHEIHTKSKFGFAIVLPRIFRAIFSA